MPPRVSITEARAQVVSPAETDWTCVVIGCASKSPLPAGRLSTTYGSPFAFIDDFGYGGGVDLLAHAIAKTPAYRAQPPMAFYRTPSTTSGSYGTINLSAFTGTAMPANKTATAPLGVYQPYGIVIDGGILGIDGITIAYSLDGGRTLSDPIPLHTDLDYDFPHDEAGFLFGASTTNADYIDLATELRSDAIAHYANATAHDAADTVAAAIITLSAPTTIAEATAVVNQVRTAHESHRKNITGVHDGPDIVNVVTLPAATTTVEGIALAISLKAILNAHDGATFVAAGAGLLGATASIGSPTVYNAAINFLAGGVAACASSSTVAAPRRTCRTPWTSADSI